MNNEGYTSDNLDMIETHIEEIVTAPPSSSEPSSSSNSTRCTLAQCFATFVNSLSYMSLGLMYTISAVVIENVHNAKSGLSLDDEQVSWFASLLPIFQPFGCFLGGVLQNYIGRKHGLVLTNVSTVAAWILLYKASSVEMLYMSSILMGISIGFSEAPCVTYVSEITTPKLRGTLISYNNSNVVFGITLTFLLASIMSWRTECLVCMGLSVFSVVLLTLIPDSPIWLINQGRTEEAIKALRWLRGWVSEADVMPEYEELSQFIRRSYSSDSINTPRKQKFKMTYLLEKSTVRPFIFLNVYSFFASAASLQAARSYFVVILNELDLPVNSNWLLFVSGVASMVGAFACAGTVKMYGKRTLSLLSMITCSILSLAFSLCMVWRQELDQPWVFIVLFIVLGFMMSLGICTIPWVLLGEIFPVKSRSVAAGVTGATYYISIFILVKTYYYLQLFMFTQGVFILYSILGFVGSVYLWIEMPETEGKTMAEIEELFADNARKSCSHFQNKK